MDVMNQFLQSEINTQELYKDIIDFICSYHIRSGEFEGNEYIIKKMDCLNFIIYPEYIINKQREIPAAISIYCNDLIANINNYAKAKGINIEKFSKKNY